MLTHAARMLTHAAGKKRPYDDARLLPSHNTTKRQRAWQEQVAYADVCCMHADVCSIRQHMAGAGGLSSVCCVRIFTCVPVNASKLSTLLYESIK